MTPTEDTRAAPRFDVRGPVEYRFADHRGEGLVWNVSTSGARIDLAFPPVACGTRIQCRFSFYPGSFDTPITAQVVRRTESGFAVQFCDLGPRQNRMLLNALPNPGAAEN
jgi:hypothetical protein